MGLKIALSPLHPGGFIKRSVLPDDLTITEAAKILGVGRPALSNVLNEKAAMSPEMALRLEKAFGVKMDILLKMQARFDAFKMRQSADGIKVTPYLAA